MKTATVVSGILISVSALSSPLNAQVMDEARLTIQVITEERKSLAMGAMDLTAEQLSALSPIYDAYLKEHDEMTDLRRHLVEAFLAKYRALADEDAQVLLQELLTIDQMRLDLHRKYTAEFAKVLPPRMVLRLWQVESKLDTMMQAEVVKAVPLAR